MGIGSVELVDFELLENIATPPADTGQGAVQHSELGVGENQDVAVCPGRQGQNVEQDDIGKEW